MQVRMGLQEKGSHNAHWWLANISSALGENSFERVAWRQLAGMLIGVWYTPSSTFSGMLNWTQGHATDLEV